MKLPLGVRNQQLPSKVTEGDGEDISNTNPPPSPSEKAHKYSSSVTVTSPQTGTSNPNDGTGDWNGDKPPTAPSDIQWTDTEYRTSQEWYPYLIKDWSDDEIVAAIENESNIIVDSSCIEEREEFPKKRWPFLFGSSRGQTQHDLVLEQQDQEVNFLERLDQCSESSVSFVAEDPGNCYYDAPRTKYQAATPKPKYWHRDAIPDERLRIGN
ncbi:hypothetical protein P9112_009924 [Eukaryota sp. TZLM1-RC]